MQEGNSMKQGKRGTRVATTVVALFMLALAMPSVASAVWSGQGDWTYKTSWVNYIHIDWTGPGTQGVHDVIASSGASELSQGVFRHPVEAANTNYNRFTNAGTVALDGTVRSLNEAHLIDVQFSDPRFVVTGDTGSLTAEALYRPATMVPPAWGSPVSTGRITIATFSGLNAIRTVSGTTTTWTGAVPVLTLDASTAFSGSYPAGTAFGEITISATP
jgi:hypothetical protein